MSRRKPKKSQRAKRPGWWASLGPERRRRVLRSVGLLLLVSVVLSGAVVGADRLETDVRAQHLLAYPDANVAFVDLPSTLYALAATDLHASMTGALDGEWTDPKTCARIARRVAEVGWVEQLHFVRRRADATFEVSAQYRLPVAMVQQGTDFLLVDDSAVRLPGRYQFDEAWPLIQGVQALPPDAGKAWSGTDIRAALGLRKLIAHEPFARQITAVLVDNFDGRQDRLASHIELATDRAGGRIRWGSAPGREFEENTASMKIAILRANYAESGRCDAGYPVIDVSTHPDRFSVPR